MTVHSTQLAGRAGMTTGVVTVYTVPAGKRTIFKHAWIRNTAAAAGVCAIQVVFVGGGTAGFFYPLAATGAAGSTIGIDLWVVLNAGDKINYGPSNNNNDILFSGTELKL